MGLTNRLLPSAARIPTSVPTGKDGVNAISDVDITPFTTRTRLVRIFEKAANSGRISDDTIDQRPLSSPTAMSRGARLASTELWKTVSSRVRSTEFKVGDRAGFRSSAERPWHPGRREVFGVA
jgi:hypothetical protein